MTLHGVPNRRLCTGLRRKRACDKALSHARRSLVAALVLATGGTLANRAHALPQGVSHQTRTLDTTEVLARISTAYRGGPCADRVSIVATPYPAIEGPLPARAIRRAVAIVRTSRSATSPPLIRLELGDLRLFAGSGTISAIRQGDREHVARFECDGDPSPAELARHLPLLTFPQVWLALGNDTSEPFCSLTGVVAWESAESVASGSRRLLVLHGRSHTHLVTLSAIAGTGRIDSYLIVPIDGAGARIEARCAAITPGDPSSWSIDPGTRAVVRSLGDLRSAPGLLEPGATIVDPPLQTLDMHAWSLVGALKARTGPRPPVGVMILFTRDATPAAIESAVSGALRAEVALDLEAAAPTPLEASSGQSPPPLLLSLGAACFSPASFSAPSLAAAGDAWRDSSRNVLARVMPQASFEPVTFTWTTSGEEMLSRLAPGSRCAVVLVTDDLRLLGVIEPEGKPGEDAVIADQVRAITSELRWPLVPE